METKLLFVYGTLMKDEPAHHYLQGAKILRPYSDGFRIPGVLLNLGHFPGLVPDSLCYAHGEVYEVNEEQIALMDRYENVPHLYLRKGIRTPMGIVWAYYLNNGPELKPDTLCCAGGKWKHRVSVRYADLCSYFRGFTKADAAVGGSENVLALPAPTTAPVVTKPKPRFAPALKVAP